MLKKINKTTYDKIINNNSNDRLRVVVGDDKQPDFKPQFKIEKWDNECNVSVRLKDDYKHSPKEEKEKVVSKKPKHDARLYELEDGFEFDVVLKEKPKSNILEFTLETKEVDFFYQPEISDDEALELIETIKKQNTKLKEKGKDERPIPTLLEAKREIRPENVVGSYAVYHSSKRDNEKYKVGKVGHIYRPKIYDNEGNETWGSLKIEGKILTVEIPQEFLDKGIYPIVVDPTFGYTTAGSSYTYGLSDAFARTVTPSSGGTVDSISCYIQEDFGGHYGYEGFITDATNYEIIINGAVGRVSGSGPLTFDWYTQSFTTKPTVVSGGNYAWIHLDAEMAMDIAYDSGNTGDGLLDNSNSYTSPPPDPTDASEDSNRYSVYATYTEASSGTDDNDERNIEVEGEKESNSERGIELEGQAQSTDDDDERNIELTAKANSNADTNLEITGKNSSNTERGLEIEGNLSDNSDINLELSSDDTIEAKENTGVIANDWDDWDNVGDFSWSTTDYKEGIGSLVITTQSSSRSAIYKTLTGSELDLVNKDIRVLVKCSNWSAVNQATLRFASDLWSISDSFIINFKSRLINAPNDEWIEVVVPIAGTEFEGNVDLNRLDMAFITLQDDGSERVSMKINVVDTIHKSPNSAVCICFDDGKEELMPSKAIMDDAGFKGTLFIDPDYIGESGFITKSQLDSFSSNGWSIGGHRMGILTALTEEQLNNHFNSVKNYLQTNNYLGSNLYAYPNGAFNDEIFESLLSHNFKYGFNINGYIQPLSYVSNTSVNRHSIDKWTTQEMVKNWIDQAEENGGVCILNFHKLVDTLVDGEDWLTSDFEDIIDYLVDNNINVQELSSIDFNNYERQIILTGAYNVSNDCNIILDGKAGDNSDVNLELVGKEENNNDTNLEIIGKDIDNSSVNLELEGQEKLDTNSDRNLELLGKENTSSDTNLELTSKDEASDESSVEINAKESDNSERDVELNVEEDLNSDKNIKLTGKEDINDEKNIDLSGKEDIDDNRGIELIGESQYTDEQSERNIDITGDKDTNTNRDIEIIVEEDAGDENSLDITGNEDATDENLVEVNSEKDTNSEISIEVNSKEDTSDENLIELSSDKDLSDEKNLDITGSKEASDERNLEMETEADENDERGVEIPVDGGEFSDRRIELHGINTTQDDRDVEINGREDIDSDSNIEINSEEDTNSDKSIEISSEEYISSDRNIELNSKNDANNDRGINITGKKEIQKEEDIEISGKEEVSDNRGMELEGIEPETLSERDIELIGEEEANTENNLEISSEVDKTSEKYIEINSKDKAVEEKDIELTSKLSDNSEKDLDLFGVEAEEDDVDIELSGYSEFKGNYIEIEVNIISNKLEFNRIKEEEDLNIIKTSLIIDNKIIEKEKKIIATINIVLVKRI